MAARETLLVRAIVWLAFAAHPAQAQDFRPLAGFEHLHGATTVAAHPASGRIAVGANGSVWIAPTGEIAQRTFRGGEVRDLAFAPDGGLWVASERGVSELADGRATPHALGPGAAGRATRLAFLGGALLVGTEDGLALRPAGGVLARVNGNLPEGAVRAIAALDHHTALAAIGPDIVRVVLDPSARGVVEVAREPLAAGDGDPLDLAALPSGEALALRERGLARRDARGRWQPIPLALPPGAAPARVLALASRVWIATDAGLLSARAPSGAFERASAPAGGAAIAALAATEHELLVAGPRGVLRAALETPLPAAREPGAPGLASDSSRREPSVLAVQRAAIQHLALEPERIASLRERPRRSAYAPALELFGSYGGDDSKDHDWDETFTSGEGRLFLDRHRESGHDFDAGVRLHWGFGGAVFHPEEIDASREAREWIELRDEVLDEVSQLYFERRRVLLDAGREVDPHAAARLRLRAGELAAGLDAWTGGWWSAQLEVLSPRGPFLESTP